ncbi:hypothetical protein PHYSODRAFT_510323 [Phytophthora sojae]|uniref:Uncharacterized protein n=1 Tax=Phytophthora sojae (strain P6497) TaxID=1094619 RepID=G4ZMW0_PHYSP|nr:hypothetical protein PHYSODRAFT_510323 [Phytophthora sojae]EGZ14683.1 hypothetical protein PHYSODRAFT_510323 [Phytophthora sojae]|eukprot:XP_009528432.1 hypothetical protein PHYSODRAFT_510323 [Phytophthora sojae]
MCPLGEPINNDPNRVTSSSRSVIKSIEMDRHRSSGICNGSKSPGVFVYRGLLRRQSSQCAMYFLIVRAVGTGMPTVVDIGRFSDDTVLECHDVWDHDTRLLVCLYCFSDAPHTTDAVPRLLIARGMSPITLSFVHPAIIALIRSTLGLISISRSW